MDEGRKRVLLIAASILAARKLAQYDSGARVPAFDFRALRDIKEGTELTVDSSTYSDHAKAKSTSRRK